MSKYIGAIPLPLDVLLIIEKQAKLDFLIARQKIRKLIVPLKFTGAVTRIQGIETIYTICDYATMAHSVSYKITTKYARNCTVLSHGFGRGDRPPRMLIIFDDF